MGYMRKKMLENPDFIIELHKLEIFISTRNRNRRK